MTGEALTLFRGPSAVRRAVLRLAREIDRDCGAEPLLVIGVLKGSFVFLSDLLRAMRSQVSVDFVQVRSYGRGTSPGRIELLRDVEAPVKRRNVLLVDDVVDTGLTTQFLLRHLGRRRPASLRTCALVDKPSRRLAEVPLHYLGFTAPDRFLVGYGMDLAERFRQLPAIYFADTPSR